MPERSDWSPGSSESSGDGDSLDAALDSFLAWAEEEEVQDQVHDLPNPGLIQVAAGSVLGEFELGRELGAGGMGVVYEARQLSVFGRRVAVKVLRNLFSSRKLEERFRREVDSISSLDHPGIVPIVAAGVDRGVPYYAMRFVEGMSAARLLRALKERARLPPSTADLRRLFDRLPALEGPPEEETPIEDLDSEWAWEDSYARWVARIGMLVAEALHHAHEHGVVHRDVKPANIVITPCGRPVLLDFGLANRTQDETLTLTGDFLGTLAYASPEQVRGEEVDGTADVYSLGATLYELLTLRRPFEAANRTDLLRRIEHDEPAALEPWIPRDLGTIVLTALSRSRSRRYGSGAALAHDLRSFLAGQAIEARPPGLLARAGVQLRRHAAVLSVAFLVVFAVFTLLSTFGARRAAAAWVESGNAELTTGHAARARLGTALQLEDRYDDWRRAGTYRSPDRATLAELRAEVHAAWDAADTSFRRAFEHVADYGPARRGMADLLGARLLAALADDRDVLAPDEIRQVEVELSRFVDLIDRELLSRSGPLRLTTTPPGARASLHRQEPGRAGRGPALLETTTPIDLAALPEGAYVAELRLDGHAPTRLPFLVRRAARLALGGHGPANDYHVELCPAELLPAGFVHVPGGWTLCRDEPVRWELLEGFCVQRDEVTLGDWLALRNALPDAFTRPPRDPYEPSLLFVEPHPDRDWTLVEDKDPDWPVHGLTRYEMDHFVGALRRRSPPADPAWYFSLPTRAEWLRAARGADARPYPWGYGFAWDRCAGLPSHALKDSVDPFPIGTFRDDLSPFGVRDLAGSIAEATLAPFPTVRGEFLYCGGSYWNTQPEEMRVTHTRGFLNEPRSNAGFRLVLRRLPAWARRAPEEPAVFHDDFERADTSELGNGWVETVSQPLAGRVDPNMTEVGWIDSGRLVLQGGAEHHSEHACAYRVLPVTAAGFTLRAVLRADHARLDGSGRSFGVHLHSGLVGASEYVRLAVDFDGRVQLQQGGRSASAVAGTVPPRSPLAYELRVRPARLEARVWPHGTPRPEAPTVLLEDVDLEVPLRFLQLSAQNLIGIRLEVDEVEVVPAELER